MKASLHGATSFLGLLCCIFGSFTLGLISFISAQENPGYAILPEVKQENISGLAKDIEQVGSTAGEVWNQYNQKAQEYEKEADIAASITTGIMTRNTILQYLVYLVKFISQIGLVIGAGMIIYAGYLYATDIFGGKPSSGNTAIKYAVIGILVISFAYTIMKIFTSAFLGT